MNAQHEMLTGFRRASIVATIVFLSIAAIIGIIALFTGSWSDLHTKIIGTTLLAAAFSVVLLVHLSIFESIPRALFWAAITLGFVAVLISLFMVWYEWDWSSYIDWENPPAWYEIQQMLWRAIWLTWLYTSFFSHLNLMLLVRKSSKALIQAILWSTIFISLIITGLLTAVIVTDGDFWFEYLDRILGALFILWALGTIVLPILARVLGGKPELQQFTSVMLPTELVNRLEHNAQARGQNLVDYLKGL